MNRLSLPMRVTPLSLVVPRFIVQFSRNTFRSPISSRVGSPLYFLSCGASPIEANWKIGCPRRCVVGPWITRADRSRVPRADLRRPRRSQNGADLTSAASCAWRRASVRSIAHRGIDHFGRSPAPPSSRRCTLPRLPPRATVENFQMPLKRALERRREHQLIAGLHRPAEARLVDADEIETRVLVRIDPRGDEARMPAVCASASRIITPGITGRCGKMTDEERLVDGDVLERTDALARTRIRARGRPAGTDSDAAAAAGSRDIHAIASSHVSALAL